MNTLRFYLKLLPIVGILLGYSCSQKANTFLADDGSVASNGITQARDMPQYDDAGNFYSRWHGPNTENEENTVRDFIWTHWTEKRRGYIKMTSVGADTRETTHFFIEPDENGGFQIARRNLHFHYDPKYNNVRTTDDIVTVERNDSTKEDPDWQIVFKSKDGSVLNSVPAPAK